MTVQLKMKVRLALTAIVVAAATSRLSLAQTSGTCANPPAMSLKPGNVLTIIGQKAGFTVVGTEQDGIRVSCTLSHQEDAGKIQLSFSPVAGASSLRLKGGPKDNVSVRIEVPFRTDLTLRATSGEWNVKNVIGNKSIHLRFGDITVSPVLPAEYGSVKGSARIGDVHVPGKDVNKEDFFRSFTIDGARGKYSLEAHVTAGDVTFEAP